MDAVSYRQPEMVALLLESGADVNLLDRLEHTPLYLAVMEGHLEVIRILLGYGADPNIREGLRLNSPLMAAISKDSAEIAKLLIDAGADPWAECLFGEHAVSFAIGFQRQGILEYLISKGLDLQHMDERTGTPLQWAIGYRGFDAAALLISMGADVNVRSSKGLSPLMHAAWLGDEDLVTLLLDARADMSLKDHEGRAVQDWAKTGEIRRLLEERNTRAGGEEQT